MPIFSFNANTSRYDPKNAYWLSVCSNIIYRNANQIRKQVCNQWKLKRFNFINRKNSQCFIASNSHMILLCFRGTETSEIKDITTDLDADQVNAYGAKVHHGFHRAYQQVKSAVCTQLKKHNNKNKPIYITGHSLGGAMAVLAAMDLTNRGFNVQSIYTYGQPRVGNKAFCSLYQQRFKGCSFRLVNKDDKVPESPPKNLSIAGKKLMEYRHSPLSITIASGNRLTLDYRHSNNVLNELVELTKVASAHSSSGYVKSMLKNINVNPVANKAAPIVEGSILSAQDIEEGVEDVAKEVKGAVTGAAKKVGSRFKKFGKKLRFG